MDQPSQQDNPPQEQQPSEQPSVQASERPFGQPSGETSDHPSGQPTGQPSRQTSDQLSGQPAGQPSGQTFDQPSELSAQTSEQPPGQPSGQTSDQPSGQSFGQPSEQPSGQASGQRFGQPCGEISDQPSGQSFGQPSGQSSEQRFGQPCGETSDQPSGQPSDKPSGQPLGQPSDQPSGQPSDQPLGQPDQPSGQPSDQPSGQPSDQPLGQPSDQPLGQPSDQPLGQPSDQHSGQPFDQPSGQPSDQPLGESPEQLCRKCSENTPPNHQSNNSSKSLEQKITESFKVFFYLHIQRFHAESVSIQFNHGEQLYPLKHVKKTGDGDLWSTVYDFNIHHIGIRYRYAVSCHEGWFKRYRDEIEVYQRTAEATVQYDTFRSPNDNKYLQESLPKSSIFYMKWLFDNMDESRIKETLIQIERMNFQSTSTCLKQIVVWILERARSPRVTDVQRLYLGMFLGHLAKSNPHLFFLPLEKSTKVSSDRLLQSLESCSRLNLLPSSSRELLGTLAPYLVNSCSYPGWLTYAAYFYYYLGVENVVRQRITVQKCDKSKFWELVTLLIPVLQINEETRDVHRRFLRQMIDTAPDREAVVTLYEENVPDSFFISSTDKDHFFSEFFQDSFRNCSRRRVNPGESLLELSRMPGRLLPTMHEVVYTLLLDFSKSTEDPTAEHIEAFYELATLNNCFLSSKELESILSVLSCSKVSLLHGLLLDLLHIEKFESHWQELSFQKKVVICQVWVLTKLKNSQSKGNAAEKFVSIYQAMEQLMSCPLNNADIALAKSICQEIVKPMENGAAFLKVYKSIEKRYSDIIQECYKHHIRFLLHQDPSLTKKAVAEVNRTGSSSSESSSLSKLSQDMLLFVLEVIEITEPKDAGRENDFRAMLKYSDVWKTLLKAKGTVTKLHNDRRFQVGKQNWQSLATCIAYGKLSLEFLNEVQQQKEIISFICATVMTDPNIITEDELSKRKQEFATRISKLAERQRDCSQKFKILQLVIHYIVKLSEEVYPVHVISSQDHLISEFNQRWQKWKTQERIEDWNDDSWGILLPLLKPAKTLEPLINSESFRNLAKICLQETIADPSSVEDEKSYIHDYFTLLQYLSSTVVERFSSQWNPVMSNPGALPVETVKVLLEGLDSEESVEKEFSFLKNYFRREFSSDVKRYTNCYVKYPSVLKQVRYLLVLLDTFQLNDPLKDEWCSILKSFKSLEDDSELTLESLSQTLDKVQRVMNGLSGDEIEAIIEELGRSNELIDFVTEIVHEDIRFLIDAVEEHSDQFVSAASVSNLINVHGFLASLIKKCRIKGCDSQQFFFTLKRSSKAYQDMAVKIRECSANVNTLKGLYKSVANREEITKEIIANCLKEDEYLVELEPDDVCKVQMSYARKDQKKSVNHFLPDLHDLRSRAHLIVNSENKASLPTEKDIDIDFSKFINQINLLTEITVLLSKLQSSGYVKYRKFWKYMKGNTLENEKRTLEKELEEWEKILSSERKKSYCLNYYRSDQLCVLYDFFACHDSQVKLEDVLSLIHFVDPTITKEQLEEHRNTGQNSQQDISSEDPREMISSVGDALDKVFAKTHPVVRSMLKLTNDEEDPTLSFASKIHATAKPGELFVANLEEESQLTANVMLTLYENTSNAFPEPCQVVFCTPQTTWEEIHLILQRCFAKSENLKYNSLFCIANVELLANEIQFELVKVVKEFQNDSYSGYRLALICRGGNHNHIVEQFSQYAHRIAGMSDCALSERLVSAWPEVGMITSALPGLGKTEQIKKEAMNKSKNIITFPISGPLDQIKLVQRLKDLKLKKYHCLHLDVGDVNDPLLLDTFLFQLIVIGMVSSGKQFYHLPTKYVFIEVANTLKDNLRDSLVICKYFTRVHLQWKNYEDLVVSSEVTSNIQVVCQYFDAYNRAQLESKDIHFTGPQKVKQLPANRCRKLLADHFSSNADITFTVLKTFLAVLADQLLKFSRSAFFKVAHLKSMLGIKSYGVRTNLFRALLNVSKEFASRSIATCHQIHSHTVSWQRESSEALDKAMSTKAMSAQNMVERVDGMIRWEDSNRLLLVFHGISSQTITAVYRNKARVPLNVETLLTSQVVKRKNKVLDDFKVMSQDQLQEKLERIVCTKPVTKDEDCSPMFLNYALTPDNILKMILIILRVRAHAPVIIMGETGCGKTSLVRYLANTCRIPFYTFNFHAGISSEEVVAYIDEIEKDAIEKSQQMWVFLDEINTFDHLGLISEIMCHHALLGRSLSKNLVFLAACNPYKLRPKEHIRTAGLEGKNITDEYSKLVYRVHPLPEAMLDYVWDYGSLEPKDEKVYIERMVKALGSKRNGLLVDVLADSQNFIREAENNNFCVSLRDVYRCIHLTKWFMEMIELKRKSSTTKSTCSLQGHLIEYRQMSERYDSNPFVRSIVLALAHCYQSRLSTSDSRRRYRKRMMLLFTNHGTTMHTEGKTDSFAAIVRMEEEDYLNKMELPPSTAKNAALRENVFVMLVCILNRIPIFVVGKPGCSKSLSIQLIRSNLRGRDSKNIFFRKLPQLYVVSHQCSESSSSEGIIKVFEKASKYNQGKNVLPVVLLDEVGLAENSKHKPLKVLHSLLEPSGGQLPDVAVVGISNWSLDAAKMNRAIHLSRPDPDEDDLYETGRSLVQNDGTSKVNWKHEMGSKELRCLAKGYFEYQSKQRYTNYHGLRDYYSLIKSLSPSPSLREDIDLPKINMALQRNFGGIPDELTNIQKIFLDKLKEVMIQKPLSGDGVVPVNKLIQENLAEPLARHLMLITSGDSAIGILKQNLAQLNREVFVIFGSRFEEDLSEEYNYQMLSRIILCMERNCILILRDLESIYGSLYDMLNQNYAVVGKRKNCRVALGANSNPLCRVNDGFRCIVLTDCEKVNYSDPPFLNRFEKQLLRFSDVLDTRQQTIINSLDTWVQEISTIQDHESRFNETDMFIGYHEDTLPSLVLSHSQNPEDTNEDIIKKCKGDLMWIAAPDGVLRARMSALQLNHDSSEVNDLSDEYFQKPIHSGLATFIEASTNKESPTFLGDEIGIKTIVMTFSNIHTDIQECLGSNVKCQVEQLGAYKSEKQFTETVNHFWTTFEAKLLVLQCKPELDAEHMLLARSIIEEKRTAHQQAFQETAGEKRRKHVCIIVHVQREGTINLTWQFNFLCGWQQAFLDVLEAPLVPLNKILSSNVTDLLNSTIWPLRKIAQDVLLWCFTCIKYKRQQRPLNSILNIVRNLFESKKVDMSIKQLVLQWIKAHEETENKVTGFSKGWQVKIACDRQALVNCSTLYSAMKFYVSQLVRQPLAKIIYFLEKENAWPLHVFSQWDNGISKTAYEEMWCELVLKEDIFKLAEIPKPLGAETYTLDGVNLQLHLPFSQLLINRIDGVKELFLEDHAQLKENENNVDETGQLIPSIHVQQMKRYSDIISKLVPEIEEFPPNSFNSYTNDLFDLTSRDFNPKLNRQQRVSIIKAAYVAQVKQSALQGKNTLYFYVQLHAFVWINKEQILDLLRMVVSCLPFVHQDVSERLTNEFLANHSNVLNISGKVKNDEGYFEDKSKAVRQPAGLQRDMAVEENNNAMLVKHQAKDENENANESCEEDSDEERFADILVTAYCEKMLPSKNTVENQNGGLKSWMRNSCLLLSLASNISNQTTAFHFLRLSVDLAKIMISLPTTEKEILYSLYILNEIGVSIEPKYLNAEKCFEKINEDLIKHLQEEVKPKFSSLFYGRCIDTNADAYSVPTIVEHVLSIYQADLVLMMGPVTLRLLMIEEEESPGIFTGIISKPSAIECHPCLQAIDQGLKNLSSTGEIHCASYAAVMICDQIQSLLNLDGELSIEHFNSSDSRMLICVKNAANILSNAEPKNCGLNLLCAVAFLRWFFSFLSRFITKIQIAINVLKDKSKYAILMNDINSILTTVVRDVDRRSSLQLFFLKQLRQHNSLFDLRKLCCESEMLPVIKTVWSSENNVNKAKLVSACKLDEYQQVESAYWKLIEQDRDEMLSFLEQCHQSTNHRLALLGILVNMIYLKRAERKLTDKEECLVRWFGENFEQFGSPLKDLLLRIIGLKDFKSSHLQLSPESSVDEVETALLILHISCVIASGIEDGAVTSPLYQYFTNPLKCQNTFILTLGEERKQQMLEKREVASGPSPFTCKCGLRSMFKDDQQDNRCPSCAQIHQPGAIKGTSNRGGAPSSTRGYSSVPRKESSQSRWDTCMDHMNPSVYRALHMIVHASFYTGVAVELTTIADLSLVLRHEKDSSFQTDNNCPDPWPQQFLFRQVANDLQNLTIILAAKKEIILTVMHLVVERCTDLIRGSVNGTTCSSVEERKEWEIKFSNTADTLLKEALAPTTALKKSMGRQQKLESQSNFHEDEIEELDEYPSDPDKQNRQVKRLFRVTREPTFEDFRANFTNRPNNFQERHRFLSLFFAQFDKLPLIGYIYHLLKWARLVSSTLSHRISRKNVHVFSVDDFFHGQLGDLKFNRTEDEKKSLKKLFSSFEDAWNNMRSMVNQTLGPEDKEMPRLTDSSEIAYCVIDTDCGVYLLTALKILSSLQNTILDELIFLSAVHHHPALSFLEKNANNSGVPSVSLQEAKEKDIISFHWSNKASNEVFKYSQKNPEYSKGEEIHYDFEQIEMVVAKDIALGKCHLMVSLNKFIFANDFFHSCGPLLSEIRELYPQLPLPDDVCRDLGTLKDRSKKQAQNLLQQLEVLIFLLKRVEKYDMDKTLESFAEEWLSMLPSHFPASLLPQPSNSIKLKHITALYEALEDMLVDGVIGGIPDQFRDDLTDEVKDQLDVLVGNENKLSLQDFIKALRRFVFRYLSSEKFQPESKITLSSCLKEPSLWFPCPQQPDLEVLFPKELTLAYLHSTITHLQNLEEERKCDTKQPAQRPRPAHDSNVIKKGGRRSRRF